jgi:hypothetical protein
MTGMFVMQPAMQPPIIDARSFRFDAPPAAAASAAGTAGRRPAVPDDAAAMSALLQGVS